MREDILKYVLDIIQKKYSLEEGIDVESFNYVTSGFVDSMGLIQFIFEIEEKYDIEFTDDEIEDESFCTIGGLVDVISRKIG